MSELIPASSGLPQPDWDALISCFSWDDLLRDSVAAILDRAVQSSDDASTPSPSICLTATSATPDVCPKPPLLVTVQPGKISLSIGPQLEQHRQPDGSLILDMDRSAAIAFGLLLIASACVPSAQPAANPDSTPLTPPS